MDNIIEFSARLEEMHKAGRDCKKSEIDAAALIFERLKTARSICARHFETENQTAVLSVFSELCAEARSGHGKTSRE